MNSIVRKQIAMLMVLCSITAVAYGGHDPKKAKGSISKSAVLDSRSILNISNFTTWLGANTVSNNPPSGNGTGGYYPRGTRWVIFQDGLVWGGKVYVDTARTIPAPGSQLIRVGGSTYNQGLQAGAVMGSGATAVPEDANAADVRVYRIRRDYKQMSNSELTRDAAEFNEISQIDVTTTQIAAITTQYELDWTSWPVAKGAPYIERNGVPGYQTPPPFSDTFTVDDLIAGNHDEPGVAGADPNSPADQVLWTVANDLNASVTQGLYGSNPMGMEIQLTRWGYKRSDALGQLYFTQYKLINKGGVQIAPDGSKGTYTIDSMYVAQWSDPDLGLYTDDLCGSDTALSLGYVYNGNAIDGEFTKFGLAPPAVGYDFLAGPIVPSPGDVAVFDLKLRPGYRNLPMTTFAWFAAGSSISDPPQTQYEGSIRWYKMLRGYRPDASTTADRYYPFPPGQTPGPFPLSGDPIKKTGSIDGLGEDWSFPAGDRRIVLASGPFTMLPGDTQVVVVGTVAGIGKDRLSSIALMKFNDRAVQQTYDNLFQVPAPPAAPDVKVAELNEVISLEWASNATRVNATENTVANPGNYVFEGYHVYQLPSQNSSLKEGKRIATFDVVNSIDIVDDEVFLEDLGIIVPVPVVQGLNNGVRRHFRFDKDYVKDIGKLYNGKEYYLAVTAYSVGNPGVLPRVLESSPQVLTVQPKRPFGATFTKGYADTLNVAHTSTGPLSDGLVIPVVVDPNRLTGDTYRVNFDSTGLIWSLINETQGASVVLSNQSNVSGDENYPVVDGFLLKVSGPATLGLKTDAWDWPSGSRNLTWAGGADGLHFEEFAGAVGWASPRTVFGDGTSFVPATGLKAIEIRFAPTNSVVAGDFDPNDPNASYAYRYGRSFAAAPAQPAFAPWITNASGGYSYQDYRVSAPLAVYDMDANPPRRLAIGYLENNATGGSVDGFYWPPFYSTGDNVSSNGPREWLFIMDEDYSGATPNSANQVELIAGDQKVMYFATWARRDDNPWPAGNIMTLTPNRPNTSNDVFQFSAPAPTITAGNQIASVDRVGVFPNPYYGFNAAETNRLIRFVTFNNLSPKATVRIFNLAGQLVRTIKKDDTSQFLRWDLTNQDNFPVASGIYIAHLELTMPADNSVVTKTLKVAIIQEQEILDIY